MNAIARWLVPDGLRRLRWRLRALDRLAALDQLGRLDQVMEALGRIEARQLDGVQGTLAEHEFRVFSHAGEDGIIQFLTRVVAVPSRTFVEFGVEDYREANTRFLLAVDGWSGLVLDGDPANVERIRADPLFWNSDLTAIPAFVTRENVNTLLSSAGLPEDIGLLSIDVDGNDYWIFDAITAVRPAIAVVEYNHRFGPTRATTIPYDPAFVRRQSDASWLVCGASLAAIVKVAERKGMAFVGCNTFGNNAFFVRTELLPAWLPTYTAEEGFVRGRFKEAMTVGGALVVPGPDEEARLIEGAVLMDVT
jgi:hypothetical protein